MSIQDLILAQFSALFLNTNLPCNELLYEQVLAHMKCQCNIIERSADVLIVSFAFTEQVIGLRCVIDNSDGVHNWCRKVTIVNDPIS
jgi:hypothetical protein